MVHQDETPLIGVIPPVRRVWLGVVEEVAWGANEMHDVLMSLCPPSPLPRAEQRRLACVRYNPFYWVGLGFLTLSVLAGRWVHALFGQGGPVREDELRVEREMRIGMIYLNDGPFALAAVGSFATLLADDDKKEVWSALFDLLIDVSYVLGNVFFFNAMRKRDPLETRAGIVANATFAAGLVCLLVLGVYWAGFMDHRWRPNKAADWIVRAIVVLFILADASLCTRLWHAYGAHGPSRWWKANKLLHSAAIVGAAVFVWTLLVVAVALGGPKIIWAAVAS